MVPAPNLTVTAWTADLEGTWSTPQDFVSTITERVLSAWEAGAEVVLLPEFLWLGLERFTHGVAEISRLFWETLWPGIFAALSKPGKCVVLGTAPFQTAHGLHNRGIIISGGIAHFQDKLCLTPWEKSFAPGQGIHVWELFGWRLAVLICLDIEMPEHSLTLRGEQIDLLLVPSATETILGTERIARCASARAVEIGCYVVVSHLVGTCSTSELVDENLGRLACYTPSQAAFRKHLRMDEGPILTSGWTCQTWALSGRALQNMRRNRVETNPALSFQRNDQKGSENKSEEGPGEATRFHGGQGG